ncbi:MAG: pyridoxal phosphate-dependent aminotransferase [Alcanivoracaceae bacterium]
MPSSIRQASRCQRIAPFQVMALLERAQQMQAAGRDVIHLEVGEPDFPTPAPVMAAARRALDAGQTRYSPAAGLPALREAVAGWYQVRFQVTVSPEQVVMTPGASGALQLAMAALVEPGDGVLMADPGYPCNRHFLELVGGQAQPLPLDAQLRVTATALEQHWQANTVAALLASPDNPTGTVLSGEEMAALAGVVSRHDGVLVMDEIYQGLVYDQVPETVLSVTDRALVLNSFSKFFGMTGWRLGWLVAPQALVPALERMAQNFFLAPSTPAQYAALAAFDADTLEELETRRQALQARRDYLLDALPGLGLSVCGDPAGAFYMYLDVSAITDDSFRFCNDLLEQQALAMTPGMDFGPAHGPQRYVRIAYTATVERLEEAVARLGRFLGKAG